MKTEQFIERFDGARVYHIAALWDRVVVGWNLFMLDSKGKVPWECEEVTIPFDKIENAKLVHLLSEGPHPTDGNDFLFLLIAEIVALYNNYVDKLSDFGGTDVQDPDSTKEQHMQPRYIIRGFGGAAKIGSVVPLSQAHLAWVAECCWDEERDLFAQDKMICLLRDMINLNEKPFRISNPLDYLREQFCFRDDTASAFDNNDDSVVVAVSKNDCFFANYQDALLVD